MTTPTYSEQSLGLVEDGFTNPYAFVRLPLLPPRRKQPEPHDAYSANLLSGRLRVRIEARTPVFTHDPSGAEDTGGRGVRRLKMARLRGRYAIPGSGLKAVVRSFAEALTGSCLSVVATPGSQSYRPGPGSAPALRYAYLVDGTQDSANLALRRVEHEPLPISEYEYDLTNWLDGQFVKYDIDEGAKEGYLKLIDVAVDADGRTTRRNQYVVRVSSDIQAQRPPDFDGIVNAYNDAIAPSIADDEREFGTEPGPFLCGRNLPEGQRQQWGQRHRRHTLTPGDIVWADADDASKVTVIGPAPDDDTIPAGFEPCTDPANLCWVCRVLGMASDDGGGKTTGVAGHVHIPWAIGPRVERGVCQDIDLPRMEGPKPSHFSFYVKRAGNGDIDFWDVEGTEIAGRKRYWHWSEDTPRPEPRKPRLCVEAVKAGTCFTADVRFDNLTEADLGLLLTALDPRLLGDGWENGTHKIGMGKPVGLGSVVTTVEEAVIVNRIARYRHLEHDGESRLNVETDLDTYVSAAWKCIRGDHGVDPTHIEDTHIEDLRILSTHVPAGEITWPRGPGGSERGDRWFAVWKNATIPLPLPTETERGWRLPRLP